MPKQPCRRPSIELNAVGRVATHGTHQLSRGIWHSTESYDAPGVRDLDGIVEFWRRQGLGYGTPLVIDADGNTALCAAMDAVTWHTGQRNTGSVGIELVGFARFTPHAWFVRIKQLRKLAQWMAWLNLEHGIPLRKSTSRGWARHWDHSLETGGTHWDPGRGFPQGFVLRLARRYREKGWA